MQNHADPYLQQALQWAAKAVHPDAEALAARRLQGGISSLVYELTLRAGGAERAVVMRLFDNAEWLGNEPDLALHEAAVLQLAASNNGVPTPGIIAYDETGSESGLPAVLMSRLAGEVDLAPPNIAGWLDGMAQALASIHDVPPGAFPWRHRRYCDASKLDTSPWSRYPERWLAAAAIVLGPEPESPKRFIHRDYHPTNILWSGGKVSGVVDWVNGCIGPAGIDVGHCRVNLAQLHGLEAADDFLNAYCRHAGDAYTYDPYWDIVSLIDYAFWEPEVYGGWTDLGVTGLTDALMVERMDLYMLSLLDRAAAYAY
ncbi:aminoglycoside phosphotransferase family protein [Paenibacillus rhizovicinus]|uniref:Aminoglycoside phosphotransferase family protein n=1 Tax=Paenibacillus rhizovicinus TaxID=2704463 RepID=A0A6C0P6T7_9BACL|nr:aminoglycoside phosphotransferase family protein [Paenibacillus rhizovicinus]QHW34071.1 aminoglycoside phosphotransferase family protein [Paenibacillus rhizovicinus]